MEPARKFPSPSASSRRKLLVVGNGATARDGAGACFINQHSCQFLIDLADAGCAVAFLQPEVPFDLHSSLYDRQIPHDKVHVLTLPRRAAKRVLAVGPILSAIQRADLVYLFYPGALSRQVARWCRLIGKPYALYLRGEQFRDAQDASICRGARFVISVSDVLAARLGCSDRRLTTIRPMLDVSREDAARRDVTRRAPIQLLFVGRLEVPKGVPELIDAAERLADRGVDFELSLVGGGPLHGELSRRFPEDRDSGIRVTGAISDRARLMRLYERADIFILPTHHEGFPRVLYEAMIKSTAIVTTMVGGIPGLMKDQENCLAIPVGDPEAIASAIERLARDPTLIDRLAKAGLETVLHMMHSRPSHLDAVVSRLDG